jgi:ubiquinone/menaquinone biosynthesis C-methylase UbiE
MEERLELTRQAVESHFWFRGFRQFVVPVLAAAVDGRTNLRLLDCGSGTGDNLALLAPYGTAVGIDLSRPGVSRTRRLGHGGVCGDVAHLPFRDQSFDLATSFDVLQQIEHDAHAVREMARVLKPGGRVVLTLAALECLHGDHNVVWDEIRRYTPATARELVRQAGLVPERVSFLFASLFPMLLVTRTLQRATRRFRRLNETSDISVPPAPVNTVLTWLLTAEASLARVVPMPVGSSLLVTARKPRDGAEGQKRTRPPK